MNADIHTHILPFIDDGSKSLDMSYEMLKQMEADQITTVIATPHFNFMKDNLETFLNQRESSLKKVKEMTKINNLNIKVLKGTELLFGPGITDLDLNDHTLGDTDYILIEFSTKKKSSNVLSSLENILAQGFIPILAHMERYSFLLEDGDLMIQLIQMGVLFQVNAETIIKDPKLSQKLFKKNLIHFIASDTHNTGKRNSNMKTALNLLSETQKSLIRHNTQQLINNELIEVLKPKKLNKLFNKYF